MKKTIAATILFFAAAGFACAQQEPQFPIPPQVEKDLAARASDVSEVTLDKAMLGFAAKFMDKDSKDADAQKLIQGLDGIYIRDYEFDKEGVVTPEEIEKLRSYFNTGDWTPMVREHDRKNHEIDDILVKRVNGEPRGLFIFSAEPRELSIVLILGPINLDDLGKLHGLAGLGNLGDIGAAARGAKTVPQGK